MPYPAASSISLITHHPELAKKLDGFIKQPLQSGPSSPCGLIITGPSGVGKTHLVEQYLNLYKKDYLLIPISHLQQQRYIPYAGIKIGIGEFLRKVYKEMAPEQSEAFSSQLKKKLGEHFPLLFDYIPELTLLIGKDTTPPNSPTPKVENQLYSLFSVLFGFLSDFLGKPLLIFIDNMQWMDGSSVNLLHFLLLRLSPKQLRLIGASRDSKTAILRVNQLMEWLNFETKNLEIIPLYGLRTEQTNAFLEEIMGAPVTASLHQLFHELCEGNPSHMQVLAESLKAEKLIGLSHGIWSGDIAKIQERFNGQSSRDVLWGRLKALSSPTRNLLTWLSCIGSYNKQVLLSLFKNNEHLLLKSLQEALETGLLTMQDGDFRFSETYIGEVIYEGIPLTEKVHLHYLIGKDILQKEFSQLSNTEKVLAAQHLNQSLDLVKEKDDILLCAKLNLQVGKLQKQDNGFDQARHFLKTSSDLFKLLSWETIKDLYWETNMERAKVEYYLGEYDLAEIHLDHLLERLLDPRKRAESYILKITINNHLGRYRKVVSILQEALSELGLTLPTEEANIQAANIHLSQEIAITKEPSNNSHEDPTNQHFILKLLYVGGMALHHTADTLMIWAALQIISRAQNSKDEGVKAIGYVSYGRMNIIANNIDQGYQLGVKGLHINQSLEDMQYRCRVFGVFAFYIQPWKKAFEHSVPLLNEGMDAGRKAGDLIGLYILKTHLFNLHFLSGSPIRSLLDFTFEESYPGMELTYYITHYQKSLIRYLTGERTFFSIPRQQPSWLAAKLTIQEERFYRNHVWARYYFLFGHYEQAARCAKEANANRKLQEGSPLVPANLVLLFLSITQNWHNLPLDEAPDHLEALEEIRTDCALWHLHAPENYASTYWLLNAEWARIHGDQMDAVSKQYQNAIHEARENHYDLALANELFAKYLLSKSEKTAALKHLKASIKAYKEWEGVAKEQQLNQQYQILLNNHSKNLQPNIETVLRELSGDLELDPLSKKLMVLLMRISGTDRTGIEWIENNGDIIDQKSLHLLPKSGKAAPLPSGLMLMCHRTQSPLIVNDLSKESSFSEIAALKNSGVQSFLIQPININGYLSMVIYLENSQTEDHFSEDLASWIRIIANQGGMIIENARTHEKTLLLNQEIRKEIEEKKQLVSFIEQQKNNHLKDLIQTQEDERKRIAGDLHDSLGSLLSTIKIQLQGLQNLQSPHIKGHQDTLRKMDEAIEEVRRIAHNMSPVSLRRFGLPSALQTLVEQINVSGQIQGELQILGMEERLAEQIELTIYRICQELVQNTLKHAQASRLHLQLIHHGDSLNITIEDNGLGMDQQKVTSGFGLLGIEAKVQMLNGTFDIESRPGKGCLVVIDIPLGIPSEKKTTGE
ncbi:ATPase [Echinicola strongylocentroti]|uniref:ATPase n=1 Tax=Echinicola strongylocentroti TaxID=1795355 RepID=A0A2Z4ILM7_9BACT|nr:AAA family ATPase [Echinicola strongylocentroti]AWW31466.1 ATPase [Echinicola strongylocentroti]